MPAQKSTLKEKDPSEVTIVPGPAKELLSWPAPARPFKKRDKEYFSTIGAIVFLLVVILFFIKEWLLIAVIISFLFVSYVLASVPPGEVSHRLTTKGVVTGGKTYKWQWFNRFWFSDKWHYKILHLEAVNLFPRQLQLVLKNDQENEIKKIVEKYLVLEKPKKTLVDKAADWLTKKVPLES